MSTFEIIISILMAVISLVATGAIPWAYMVGTRLARIEVVILNGMKDEIASLKAFKEETIKVLAAIQGKPPQQ